MVRTRSMGGGGSSVVPASPAGGKNIISLQPTSPLATRKLFSSLNFGTKASNTSSPPRGSLRSGRSRLPIPSLSSLSPEDCTAQDADYEADNSDPASPDHSNTYVSEESVDQKETPRPKARNRSPRAPDENMSAATPSEATISGTTDTMTDDGGTPLNDTPIPIDLSSARRAKTPDVDLTGSSGSSSAPSTPTKLASERRQATPKGPKLISHKEASKQLRDLIVAHNKKGVEIKEILAPYRDLTRDDNATATILDECVTATNARLVRAIEDVEALEDGRPSRVTPYPADKIPELLAAVEKAEADRNAFYAETQRLFMQLAMLEGEQHALRAKAMIARKVELEARLREGMPTASAACNKPFAPSGSGLPIALGTPSGSTPTTVGRRGITNKTPIVFTSPTRPEFIGQNSNGQNFTTGMCVSSLDNPQTPTRKREVRN